MNTLDYIAFPVIMIIGMAIGLAVLYLLNKYGDK